MTSGPNTTSDTDPFEWAGAVIDGKYRIDELVGEGGFGVVYRARHLGFEEHVAVKCLRIPKALAGAERERFFEGFLAEGRLMHQLSRASAGIVQALDVGATVSPNKIWTPYLVLEWLNGITLAQDFKQRARENKGGRSLTEAIELLEPAALALAMVHGQGVAHRDVKPANLFLADVGGRRTIKVLDFGIAKVITETESVTRAFEATGSAVQAFTARYGAPEQFSRRFGATGPWTDVFALALVLVEAVAGRPALDGEDSAQLFVAATDASVRPTLRTLGVTSSDAVEQVLNCAFAVDPKLRYANAGDFWNALVAAVQETEWLETSGALSAVSARTERVESRARPTRADVDPRTELSSSTQVPALRPTSLTPMNRPTVVRVVLAVLAATTVFGIAAGVGVLFLASGDPGDPAVPASSATLELAPVATPTGSTQQATRPAPPKSFAEIPAFEVPHGDESGSGTWLNAFKAFRPKQSEGVSLEAAQAVCSSADMALCTEAQWERACSVNDRVAETPSWTLSALEDGFIARGGGSCVARQVAGSGSTDARLTGLCCERAVAGRAKKLGDSFLATATERLLELERRFNQRDFEGFTKIFDKKVSVDGKLQTRESLAKLLETSIPTDQWMLIDACNLALDTQTIYRRNRRGRVIGKTSKTQWTADCQQARVIQGDLQVVKTLYVLSGTGLLQAVSETGIVFPARGLP